VPLPRWPVNHTTGGRLTRLGGDDALHLLLRVMNEIVERVLSSSPLIADPSAREKVRNYIVLLASTGKSPRQLEAYGKAYLKELLGPDSRYSGC
jgi:hypothetical protein